MPYLGPGKNFYPQGLWGGIYDRNLEEAPVYRV
jgi:hypothetical protein